MLSRPAAKEFETPELISIATIDSKNDTCSILLFGKPLKPIFGVLRFIPSTRLLAYERKVYLDGNISVEEDSNSIKERKNLSINGMMEVTILVTPKGNIHDRPIVTVKGLPINDFEDFRFGLENEIEKTARTFSLTNSRQQENAIDAFKSVCKKYTKNKVGKRPFTNINIVQI